MIHGVSQIGPTAAEREAGSKPVRTQPERLRNVYACLVHEAQECVVDLVRNLRCLDPDSTILLYDGSSEGALLQPRSCFDKLGARLHPSPRPIEADNIYQFALDCLSYAGEHLGFDTLTIVDSDQLGVQSGWSEVLSQHLQRLALTPPPPPVYALAGGAAANSRNSDDAPPPSSRIPRLMVAELAEYGGVGLLGHGIGGKAPVRLPPDTRLTPAISAWQELALWQPLLRRFPDGARQFPRWISWPGAVFTASAGRELCAWFERDAELRHIVESSRVWGKEQILFPTLTALLGFRVEACPGSNEHVKYQVQYDGEQTSAALADEREHWMHPVPRRYDDATRTAIRSHFDQYRSASSVRARPSRRSGIQPAEAQLRQPILKEMRNIEGWLSPPEAELLISLAQQALLECPHVNALVEVGSYCGKATTVLGSVVRAVRSTARVWAIDPHDGFVGALDHGLEQVKPTLETLRQNIASANLSPFVEIVQARAQDVPWAEPICLLLIDGLHDYPSVLRDFTHFEGFLVDGGLVAFHDYTDYFPGVPAFVDELSASGRYETVARAKSLIALRKLPGTTQ
ncbi:MAG: hypothetical protein RL033_7210 [Pseudomonadota bacterium]